MDWKLQTEMKTRYMQVKSIHEKDHITKKEMNGNKINYGNIKQGIKKATVWEIKRN